MEITHLLLVLHPQEVVVEVITVLQEEVEVLEEVVENQVVLEVQARQDKEILEVKDLAVTEDQLEVVVQEPQEQQVLLVDKEELEVAHQL
jgi:hypothetical protein